MSNNNNCMLTFHFFNTLLNMKMMTAKLKKLKFSPLILPIYLAEKKTLLMLLTPKFWADNLAHNTLTLKPFQDAR